MSTFVTVGNATQPFDRLLRAVAAVTPVLPRPIVVQCGASGTSIAEWEIREVLPMERFEKLVLHATVLIMHAGAGSIIHAVKTGKKPIVMPRRASLGEHVDDHQLEFAEVLASVGLVTLVSDENELKHALEMLPLRTSTGAGTRKPQLVTAIAQILAEYGTSRDAQ